MRHKRNRHKLSRDSAHRKALMKNLSRQLIEHERIQTSQAKAKAVKPEVEQLITLAKRGDLHARRLLLSRARPGQVHRPQAGRRDRAALQRAPGRLHADRQARPAPVRLDGDGLPRTGLTAGRASGRRPVATYLASTSRLRRPPASRAGPSQPGLRTVQGELEAALARVLGEPAPLTVAGRTDARRPRARRRSPRYDRRAAPGSLRRALNALHRPATSPSPRSPRRRGFDARRDARSRALPLPGRARREPPSPFERGRALHWPHPLDRDRARTSAPRCCRARTTSRRSRRPRPTHVRFERDVLDAALARRGRRIARVRDRGRRLHAQHGPGAGRDDARGRRRPPRPGLGLPRACSTGRRARRRARRRRPRPLPGRRRLLSVPPRVPAAPLVESTRCGFCSPTTTGSAPRACRRCAARCSRSTGSSSTSSRPTRTAARRRARSRPARRSGSRRSASTTARSATRPTARRSTASASPQLGLLGEPPELIVSGINHGSNLGDDVTYSGTVAAALEGIVLGIPAIAVSQQSLGREMDFLLGREFDFSVSAPLTAALAADRRRRPPARGHAAERQLPGR